jgi:hypothetical protein
MQTLVFNTTTKTIKVYSDLKTMEIIHDLSNIPTVKVYENYYEVIQKDEFDKPYPVLRLPINNTNMIIQR